MTLITNLESELNTEKISMIFKLVNISYTAGTICINV
jgi:hypothetical protein